MARIHRATAAPTANALVLLGSVHNVLVGAKMSFITVGKDGKQVWGFLDRLQLNLKVNALFLDELPSNDLAANLAGINDQFLSSNQLFHVFIIQFGLLTTY